MYVNNLSFDSRHAWWPVPGRLAAEWTVEVFTVDNAFGLDPEATSFDGERLVCYGLQWLGGQRKFPGRVVVEVAEEDAVASWRIAVTAGEVVKGAKLLLRGLPADALESGWWSSTSAAGASVGHSDTQPVLLSYPWAGSQVPGVDWQTPWAAAGNESGICLSVRDDQVRPVRLYVYESSFTSGVVTEVCCDELATQRSDTYSSPEIRLRAFNSEAELTRDFASHLRHLENVHGLTPWAERVDVPAWAKEVELVVTLHGQHWTGHVFNTFDQMAAALRDICEDIPGSKVQMVVVLARVEAGPHALNLLHPRFPSRQVMVGRRRRAHRPFVTQRSESQISISGQDVAGCSVANRAEPCTWQKSESHAEHPWRPGP